MRLIFKRKNMDHAFQYYYIFEVGISGINKLTQLSSTA